MGTQFTVNAAVNAAMKRIVSGLLLGGLIASVAGCQISDLLADGSQGGDSGVGSTSPDATTGSNLPPGETNDGAPASGDDAGTNVNPTGDGATGNGTDDGGDITDGATGGGNDGSQGVVYYALNDPSRWSFFSAGAVANGVTKYSGVAFDGRYLYFIPQFSPPNVLRYDTQADFTDPNSYTYYAPLPAIVAAGGLNTGSYTYLGGAFDGRYIYMAPFGNNAYAVRYDTQQPFSHDESWSAFNTTTLDTAANYWGVLSDGRHTYFVPNKTTKVLAFDNGGPGDAGSDFTNASNFTSYDLGTGNGGYWGGTFDGTYVYFAPFSGSVVARHDTALPVTAGWDVGATGFDLNTNFVLGATAHFWGGAYDGNHVYMVPNATQSWTLGAYSTAGTFNDYGSWSTCALGTTLLSGSSASSAFVGAAFDGKRLLLVPFGTAVADSGAASVPVVAYDTTQPLCPSTLSSAYTTFDPTTLGGGTGAAGFEGAAFDGHYVYLIPHSNSVIARFEAKSASTAITPASYKGSWW